MLRLGCAQRDAGRRIISGFHSQLEKTMHYLLKEASPLYLYRQEVLKEAGTRIKDAQNGKRLLIVTPFDNEVKRVTTESANLRNRNS